MFLKTNFLAIVVFFVLFVLIANAAEESANESQEVDDKLNYSNVVNDNSKVDNAAEQNSINNNHNGNNQNNKNQTKSVLALEYI